MELVLQASIQNCFQSIECFHILPLNNFGLTLIRTLQISPKRISEVFRVKPAVIDIRYYFNDNLIMIYKPQRPSRYYNWLC